MIWDLIFPNYNPLGKNTNTTIAVKKYYLHMCFKAIQNEDTDAICRSITSFGYRVRASKQREFCEAVIDRYVPSNNDNAKTAVLFMSLSDLAPKSDTSLAMLRYWTLRQGKNDIFICSISCGRRFHTYAKELYQFYGSEYERKVIKPGNFPKAVVDIAMDLRISDDPVDYNDIRQYCGIGCEALINQMEKKHYNYPKKIKGRPMTEREIALVKDRLEEYYKALGLYSDKVVFDDKIQILK